jgi:hypothetical protein
MKAKWNGVEGDPNVTEAFGIAFERGKWTDIPGDLEAGFKAKLANNPTFEIEGGPAGSAPKPAKAPAPAPVKPAKAV